MTYEIVWRDANGTLHTTEESGQAAYDAFARLNRMHGCDLISARVI